MQSRQLFRGSTVAAILAVVLVACDNAPPAPSPPPQGGNPGGQPQPAGPALLRVELSGPASVAPGATAQFTLTAHYSDGSSQNRSAEASWRTSNTTVIAISAGGTAVGRERGEAALTASFGGRSATRSGVMVLPDGTFRVRGSVRDAGVSVDGAQVAVTEGPSDRLSVTTVNGSYTMYGVAAGDVELTVTKQGYQPIEQRFQVTDHQTRNFDLVLSGPRDIIQGTYTLRASAGSECRQNLPGDLQERTYSAAISQNGPQLTVTLSGGTFYKPPSTSPVLNTFRGVAEPGSVRFQLGAGYEYYSFYYGYYPDLLEQVPPANLFTMTGSVAVTPTSTGFTGALNGEFVSYSSSFRRLASCRSSNHRFELIR